MSVKKIVSKLPLIGAIGLLAAAAAVSACGGGGANAGSGGKAPVTLNYKIVGADDGKVATDGNKHDVFQALDLQPVQVGQQVTIKIENEDDAQHSMTSPDLGLNIMVPGAKDGTPGVVTYTFTPTTAGSFRWFCAIPCDSDNQGWDMTQGTKGPDQEDFMAGFITVTT